MRKFFTPDNLEDFLKGSADDLQMRPSEAVWNRLSKKLADSRRRTYLLSSLFLLGFFITGYFLNKQPFKPVDSTQSKPVVKAKVIPLTAANTSIPRSSALQGKKVKIKNNLVAVERPSASRVHNSVAESPIAEATTQNLFAPVSTQTAIASNQSAMASIPSAASPVAATKPASKKAVAAENSEAGIKKLTLRKRKWDFQFYFTPTVSYRRLTDAPTFNPALSSASPTTSVDNAVFHKPDIGFELGTAARYSVSKRVRLRTGLQLSLHRYDIRAYDHVPEMASIALNSGYSQPVIINTVSTHRNTDGFRTDWLQNSYVKISAPIGVETRIHGNEKTYIGVAGNLQPSYLLGDKAYLLSADFKNYADAANLVRRWNMSTSLETFVNYSTGHLQWQVGPQVRYQLMSSFIKAYPVKENLFDFGFKIGISANRAPLPK